MVDIAEEAFEKATSIVSRAKVILKSPAQVFNVFAPTKLPKFTPSAIELLLVPYAILNNSYTVTENLVTSCLKQARLRGDIDKSGLPHKIRLGVEGPLGSSGYVIITMLEQLNLTVESAAIDGRPVVLERLNQTLFRDLVGARLIYEHSQGTSAVTISLFENVGTSTQTLTTTAGWTSSAAQQAEQPSLMPLTLSVAVVVAVAVTLAAVTKFRASRGRV